RMANIIDMILHRDFISERPLLWAVVATAAVIVLAALTGLSTAVLPTRLAVLAGIVPIVGWLGATQITFNNGGLLPLVKPLATLAITTMAVLLFRYRVVDYESRVIRSAFGRYLAPDMVNYLSKHPDRLKLGGETRCLTLLFCDLRG